MADKSDFDPRFDAAFQRGYEGVSSARDAAAPAPRRESRPVARAVAPEPVLQVVAPSSWQQPLMEPTPEVDDEPEPRRFNPFLVALGAVSLALIIGGLYLVSQLRDLFADTQTSSEFDYVTLQVLIFAAPLLVVLGIATAIGVLFVLAVRRS